MRRGNLQRNIQQRADANLIMVANRWQPFIEEFIRRYNIQDPRILENLRGEWTRRAMAEPTVRFGNTDPNEPKLLDYLNRFGWQPGQPQQPQPAQQPGISPAAQAGIKAHPQRKQTSNWQPQPPTPAQPVQPSGLAAINQGQPVQPQPQQPAPAQPAAAQPQQGNARQEAINALVRSEARRIYAGESPEEYADRLRPGPGAALRQLFGGGENRLLNQWGGLPEGQRGPITPEEIAIAEQQPLVRERIAGQNERRMAELQREREAAAQRQAQAAAQQPAAAQPEPFNFEGLGIEADINKGPESKRSALSNMTDEQKAKIKKAAQEIRQNNPRRPNETLDEYKIRTKPLMDQAAQNILHPQQPAALPAERPLNINNNADPRNNAPVQPNMPAPQPAPEPQGPVQVNPRGAFLVDRMSALLGQGRRANRRFTPTEMKQISDLYADAQQEFGGNIPANLQQPLERIRRDFNAQAMLLNLPGLGQAAQISQAQSPAAQLNVPTDAQGNVDMKAYQTQFPQFFNQNGGLITEDKLKLSGNTQAKADQLNLYKKIRSDINQVRFANDQGELGYPVLYDKKGNLRFPRRQDEKAFNKRQDEIYRASADYRNTVLPEGLVSEQAAQQYAQPLNPEDLANQPYTVQQGNALNPAAVQRSQTTTIRQEPEIKVAATTPPAQGGTQPVATVGGQQPSGQVIQDRPHGKEVWVGGKTTLHQIPMYTPEQLRHQEEARNMGMEFLRRGFQPLVGQDQQQVQANTALQSILGRLANNDPQGAQQELTLAGGPGNILGVLHNQPGAQIPEQAQQYFSGIQPQQPQMGLPTSQMPMGNIPLPGAYQPGPQGFVAPGLQPQQGGLAGLANTAANVGRAYQQAGGGLRGVLNAIQMGAQGVAHGAQTAGQAAAIPGQVQQAYQQQGGGLRGVLNAVQQGAQGVANLGQGQGGAWPYGPAYGMGYPHPMPFTAANELNRFYGQTVPTLAERFTALGGGQRSAAFQGALGGAGRELGLGLAAQGEQQNQFNQQLGLQQQNQMFNQQQAQREFAENQRRYQQQQQMQGRQFDVNSGLQYLQHGVNPQVQPAIIPGSAGILPGMVNVAGQAIKAGAMAAML